MNIIERIDNFIQNNNVLDTVVSKVLGAVLPQKTAYAACGNTAYCGQTYGGSCDAGCDYNTCRKKVGRWIYTWMADSSLCVGMCIKATVCGPLSTGVYGVGGVCGAC